LLKQTADNIYSLGGLVLAGHNSSPVISYRGCGRSIPKLSELYGLFFVRNVLGHTKRGLGKTLALSIVILVYLLFFVFISYIRSPTYKPFYFSQFNQ